MSHYFLFIVFMLGYFYATDKLFPNHPGLTAGIAFIIGGLWGILSKRMLFRTGFTGKKQAMVVNWIIFIAGIVITILAILYE